MAAPPPGSYAVYFRRLRPEPSETETSPVHQVATSADVMAMLHEHLGHEKFDLCVVFCNSGGLGGSFFIVARFMLRLQPKTVECLIADMPNWRD